MDTTNLKSNHKGGRGIDVHRGQSKNSRKGVPRLRKSSGGEFKVYFGNSSKNCCSWCYPELCRQNGDKKVLRMTLLWAMRGEDLDVLKVVG
jgi:hypothetical protein